MDRIGADFLRGVGMIVDRLGAVPLVLHLPIGAESEFRGFVDLVRMKAIVWNDDTLGADYEVADIPSGMADAAAEWRQKLVDLAVEQDDAVMEAYLEGSEPDAETLRKRSEEHTSELQSLMRISYAVFCLKTK